MCDCSGLSGRVLELEAVVAGLADAYDYNTLSALNTSRYNSLEDTLTAAVDKLTILEQYIVNLNSSHNNLRATLTGHTGVPAKTGHRGGLSGEL